MVHIRRVSTFVALLSSVLLTGFVLAQTPTTSREREPDARPGGHAGASVSSAMGSRGSISASPEAANVPSNSGLHTNSSVLPYSADVSRQTVSTAPNYSQFINERTSFNNYSTFVRSMSLFDLLQAYYGFAFNNYYFNRYYVNNEPILNRQTLYYSLEGSSTAAQQLAQASAELQRLLAGYAGLEGAAAAAKDPRWAPLVERIKVLAKQIRQDDFLHYVDIRKTPAKVEANLNGFEKLRFAEQTQRLTGLIEQLQTQLSQMRNSPTPSVVSVDFLNQPSFQALAKGIESLAKKLEKPSKS